MSEFLTTLPPPDVPASCPSISASDTRPPLKSLHGLTGPATTAAPHSAAAHLRVENQRLEGLILELGRQLEVTADDERHHEDERCRTYALCLHEKSQEIERLEQHLTELQQARAKRTERPDEQARREQRRRSEMERLESEQKRLAHERRSLERKRRLIQEEEERVRGVMDELERFFARNRVELQHQQEELHDLYLTVCNEFEEAQRVGIAADRLQALKHQCSPNARQPSFRQVERLRRERGRQQE